MLPIERQKRIQELILQKQNMKISELSNLLNVSEMTIHRDIKPLIDQGIVIKTFGGITVANEKKPKVVSDEECIYCGRITNKRLAYRIFLSNNRTEVTCCAHCGLLRHHQLGDDAVQAICHDFLKHTTISAPLAWYVMDTSIEIGCCQPQVLSFEMEEHAKKFTKGFGGSVYNFQDATNVLLKKMNGDTSCCHK